MRWMRERLQVVYVGFVCFIRRTNNVFNHYLFAISFDLNFARIVTRRGDRTVRFALNSMPQIRFNCFKNHLFARNSPVSHFWLVSGHSVRACLAGMVQHSAQTFVRSSCCLDRSRSTTDTEVPRRAEATCLAWFHSVYVIVGSCLHWSCYTFICIIMNWIAKPTTHYPTKVSHTSSWAIGSDRCEAPLLQLISSLCFLEEWVCCSCLNVDNDGKIRRIVVVADYFSNNEIV